jgi:general secretion pathway protein E
MKDGGEPHWQPITAAQFEGASDPWDLAFARAFLDDLVAHRHLDPLQADRAFQAQRQAGERIDVAIVQLGLMSDEVMLQELARYTHIPLAPADCFPREPIFPKLLDASWIKRLGIVPVEMRQDTVVVVTSDAFARDALASVSYLIDRSVEPMLALVKDVKSAIDRLYGPGKDVQTSDDDTATDLDAREDDVQRLRDIASEAPIIRLVSRLISSAVAQRASDIHIEPLSDCLRIRYRVDGIMTEVERFPLDMQAGIATRIKILGRLNIAERRLPQDGRTRAVVGGREIDLRLSTTPLLHGESIVMRILDRDAVELDFDKLGFDTSTQARLRQMILAPNGILLVTGPTGSGKTTTLYTALKMLNSIERKVFTVEDPIEYQLHGVNQMQIKPTIGLDFAHCLRSILRQDPDVVMIGEMRDIETAKTGIQASLTGHLVLSTLHTNSAAASITRLLDLGAEDYLLASTISGILAQRLVRRLCQKCATPEADGFAILDRHGIRWSDFVRTLPKFLPRRPVGCAHCRQSGFNGRTTIAELLSVDDAVRAKIVRGVTDRQIETAAADAGMETLLQSGLRKVAAGETTIDEVLRVARA